MSNFEVLNEAPMSLAEVLQGLAEIEKRDKELSFRGNRTKEYLGTLTAKKLKEVQDLRKKIEALNIPRLKDRHIIKMIDVAPQDMDSLKLLISGEAITVKDEDLKKVLELL
ncbi:hypothetical protein HY501_01665 [Candidatus Woesearchaeota archaeon]|nr:hypothetical protein [Candidatus Woesearchaeota archaeon]